MSSCQELYNRLNETICEAVEVSNRKQLTNWIWIVVGLLLGHSPALSQIAMYLPMKTEAESRVTLVRRWLKNFRVDVWAFHQPILAQVFKGWQTVEAFIILDGVMVFGDRWQIFRLSLQHGGRAIPLAWVVIEGKGVTQANKLEAMLKRVATFLRKRVKQVTFLADRGFRDCDWGQMCLKLGWNYGIRVTCTTFVTLEDGRACRIDQLGVPACQRRYYQNVLLTQAETLRTNLSVGWTVGDEKHQPELIAVISKQPAGRVRLGEYGRRMSIEQSFRDDKSGGFDMAHTRLQHADRIERLLLAIASATLWCHELGEHVLAEGEPARRQIDPGPTRELSLFQLGLRWLKRYLVTANHYLPAFLAHLTNLSLEPVVNLHTA